MKYINFGLDVDAWYAAVDKAAETMLKNSYIKQDVIKCSALIRLPEAAAAFYGYKSLYREAYNLLVDLVIGVEIERRELNKKPIP